MVSAYLLTLKAPLIIDRVEIDPQVVKTAGEALGSALSDAEKLESPNLVFRAATEDGGSVVVKRVTMTEWNRGDGDESEQLLNEWCVLEHLEGKVAPRLLAADRKASLIVIEDLGDRSTVEKALLDPSTTNARAMLEQAGAALAQMHGAGVGREEEFLSLQASRGVLSPRSDSTVDFRVERRDLFLAFFEAIDVEVHRDFWSEVEKLEVAIHDDGLFRTLVHADAGPQNFLVGPDMHIIDFEFGVYLNAMCDLGGARGGFPQTWDAAWVDPADASLFENSYRSVAADIWPEAQDDVFIEHLMMGTAHWALNRIAGDWRGAFEPMLAGTYEGEHAEKKRRHHATLWTGFCDSADELGLLGPISTTVRSVLEGLQARFDDMVPLPRYPALME